MWRIEDKPNFVGLTERHELQRQGIEVAKAGGKHLGRPRVEYPENWEDGGIHCGEVFEFRLNDVWVPARMEMGMDDRWYLVGLPGLMLDGLDVRQG